MKNMIGCAAMIAALSFAPMLAAQEYGHEHMTQIEPGTLVGVQLNQTIHANGATNEVYTGTVVQDVIGGNGRLAIPRGSQVNLRVRSTREGNLVLNVDSVSLHGREYALPTSSQNMEGQSGNNNNVVGSIVGGVTGQQPQGPEVRVQRGTVLNFRINEPVQMPSSHENQGGYDR